ncbi:family 2A encapsulin nanocompartment cargo protein cysteine desulfurase [Dechloromonas denitrificans]|uniref:family 2A encapsulin nanocompartment cargo protein cysteine desulfurase n=1 Tax=Dechloromonas denitrificans TaxID=281362 RepID=UPI001CFAB16D|nr:family 2A encapsulin nanocompartment cargo protein cysteine desulfurase [Dechloromonas denitrificans]UCV05951.1 SufS family cysteine desulfurase [Dechloromonas denitrificans]
MTIPTPTSNGVDGLGGGAPSGLPDEATLGRLASAFFQALPGAALPSFDELPTSLGAGSAPAPELSLAQSGPSILPQPVAPDVVDPLGSGGAEFGVPEAYAASLPSVTPPQPPSAFSEALPASPPGSPYYFIGEASPYAQSGGTPAKPENRVVAQPFGLPGEGELKSLLAEIAADRQPVEAVGQPANTGNFYFLDAAKVPDAGPTARPAFDVNAVRRDFPILQERVNGKPLVWFDNAATTQKPQSVIDRLAYFYAHENSNIHRAAHELAARATDAYEAARQKVQRFLGAGSADEIIFVRGATEAINLVAKTWGVQNIGEGDEIVVSLLEHHANIVPWQQLAQQTGAKIRVIPVDDSGQLKLDELQKLLNPKTKLVSVTQVSNALGTVTPIKQVIDMAHAAGAKVLVDGAQSVSHLRVNVQALDADFFVFSGHKIFGPTGIGVVYGKKALLEQMPPWQGGGNMIADVTFEKTLFQPAPNKFEAGTGNIADAVGLGAALDYVERIGLENIARYEHDLLVYATRGLSSIPGVRLIGTAADKASVASFVLAGYSTEEVGRGLNEEGIAVRSGHHCAQPILRRFGVEATVRPSLAFYNTCEEIDRMLAVVRRLARGKGKIAA